MTMKLTKIKIEKFKRIESVELELADVTVLVGANGCGKSSILQAIHLACCVIRQADGVGAKSNPVGIDELDYLPTENYKLLGHGANWGNADGSPSTNLSFTFEKDSNSYDATCELRSARNAGISIRGKIPTELNAALRTKTAFFSAYIPGISGIPNKEEKRSRKVVLKACSFGDSNVILRNGLLLLGKQKIKELEKWLAVIIGPVEIDVKHEDANDLAIRCNIKINGDSRPIELIGTGYIQLIQIFSYILLFKPGILLIDEPDIHLHPSVQEKLVQILASVAAETGVKILLTTHSPFIVRGLPLNSKVYWLNNGKIESDNRGAVELALGWGAFGKKILIYSEDDDTKWLSKLISQWPEIEKYVAIIPGNGFNNLITSAQAEKLYSRLGEMYKILVHRDRDALTDEEVRSLKAAYDKSGVSIWFTDDSDLEAYFCNTDVIREFLQCEAEKADDYLKRANGFDIKSEFAKQRVAINRELYPQGGSPTNVKVWEELQDRPLKGAKGKSVFRQLKSLLQKEKFNEDNVRGKNYSITLEASLKKELARLLAITRG